MKDGPGPQQRRPESGDRGSLRRIGLALVALAALAAGSAATAHSPVLDHNVTDWCLGAFSNTNQGGGRIEDSSATLTCGNCSISSRACVVNADCPVGQTCVNPGSKTEIVWWDNRTDAAVNDIATLAMTQDQTRLYFALQLWVNPDPVSLPLLEIGIDFRPGGIATWHDPAGALTNPGYCSVSTDRACAGIPGPSDPNGNADCWFCTQSTEPLPSTRPRTCGSGCNPDVPADVCNTSQTCIDFGSRGPLPFVGVNAAPLSLPDYLIVFDSGRWLIGAPDSIQLMRDAGGMWTPVAAFQLPSNPGASGVPGDPVSSTEFAIPWSAFGCTGCPAACSCPDFGPGQDFRFNTMMARATLSVDYTPDGAIEDVQSEAVAGTTTTSADSCPGFGTVTTRCEIADGSQDAFAPAAGPPSPGGRADGLVLAKDEAPSIRLSWNPSCSTADVDYEVYEGNIGSWYDHAHVPGLCATGAATTASFAPGPDSHYYLVVPTDGSTEGSYGADGAALERPASSVPCRTQALGGCPDTAGPVFAISELAQIGVTLEETSLSSSDWGSVDLTFIGSTDMRYFNLVVNGNWRVRDLPVLSTEGAGQVQTQTVNFRILADAVTPPSFVSMVNYVASLTTTPAGAAPMAPVIQANVISRPVRLYSGEQGESLGLKSARTVTGGTATQSAFNGHVPDQEVGRNACVPGAISNSLMFLDDRHMLNIPAGKITIDAMKTATSWTASGAPVGPTPWWDLKRAALDADPSIPVTTTTSQSFDQAMAALNDDCDVELRAPGHVAVVRGIVKLAGGNRAIVVQHDTFQGFAGGSKREVVIYDAAEGKLWDGWGFDGQPFDRFVIECPE